MPRMPVSMTCVHVTRNGVDILPGKLLHSPCDRMSTFEWVQLSLDAVMLYCGLCVF